MTRSRPLVSSVALLISLAMATPLLYLLRQSFASEGTAWTLGTYRHLLAEPMLYRSVANSLFLASIQAIAVVLLASLAGHAVAFHRFVGRKLFLAALVLVSILPPQLLLPGGYELVARLHLFDTYLAVLLPGALSTLAVLLYRAAYAAVPPELVEAARVDGCSEWGTWWRITLPAVRPTTAACLLLTFAGSWNAVVWPVVVLQDPRLHTLPITLATISGTALTAEQQAQVLVGTVIALVPVLLLFLLLQRDFLPGLLRGAVKG